jgi:hypothetical protein
VAPIDALSSAACLLLAGTFIVAAGAKAGRPLTTAASFQALGLPFSSVLARLVPALETAIAVALLTVPRVGAVVALVLLSGFTVVLWSARRRLGDVQCACFGGLTPAPVTWVTFLRNALLAVAAAVATTASALHLTLAIVLSTIALALGGACLLGLAGMAHSTGGLFHPHPSASPGRKAHP